MTKLNHPFEFLVVKYLFEVVGFARRLSYVALIKRDELFYGGIVCTPFSSCYCTC